MLQGDNEMILEYLQAHSKRLCIWQHPHPCDKVNRMMLFISCLALLNNNCSTHATLRVHRAVALRQIAIET